LFQGQAHGPGIFPIGWPGIDSQENAGFKQISVSACRFVGDGLIRDGRRLGRRRMVVDVMMGMINDILMIIHSVILRGMRRIMGGIVMVGVVRCIVTWFIMAIAAVTI
jgi:hypothetical protein